MTSLGLRPDDFKKLDPEQFEALVSHLLEAMMYDIVQAPGRGTDEGCDILIERIDKDAMIKRRERVVVQCKHKAKSKVAVSYNEINVFLNAMTINNAQGYLLITSSRVSRAVSKTFTKYTENNANIGKWASFWDVDKLIALLNEKTMVRDSFFPTGVEQALIGEKISKSPFRFEALLQGAKKNIFIAGQVLNHITRTENKKTYRELLFSALKRGILVQIMLCDPSAEFAVRTWQSVVGTTYGSTLDKSTTILQEWLRSAKRSKLKGLEIKSTILVPLTITFVDPDEEFGRLIFIPVVYEPQSDLRPCFAILKKHHPYVFDYYWFSYKAVFDRKETRFIDKISLNHA